MGGKKEKEHDKSVLEDHDKSVLEDKDKFGKSEAGEKVAHMGDKPKPPSDKSKAKES